MMRRYFTILSLLVGLAFMFSCSSSTDNDDKETKSNFEIIQPVVDDAISNWTNPVTPAQTIHDGLNNYFVVSVRGADDYAKGHVPGAINIPWTTIAKEENLAQIPTDKTVAVYCYTGHTGQIAATVLKVLGYDVTNMKWGIMSWTKDQTVRAAAAFNEDTDAHDYPITTEVPAAQTYDLPDPNFVDSEDAMTILKAAADQYVSTQAPVILAQALFDNLNDGNAANDPQIISVRSADHYAIGHIPGAINIPWQEIAKVENLQKIDPNREVVVYCYTGHTGQIASTALNLLGYNAINLKWGIMSWTKDANVRVLSPFNENTDANDFALEK
ncbi:rhodanese-like domain-containing protein [Caldithrix abyssi]